MNCYSSGPYSDYLMTTDLHEKGAWKYGDNAQRNMSTSRYMSLQLQKGLYRRKSFQEFHIKRIKAMWTI